MTAPATDAAVADRTGADPRFAARAVARLSTIEFWERYSFFTVFALLALFVSAPPARGGMGWANGESLRFFGLYILVVQSSPLIGGWIADRWLGKRMALRMGAASLSIGHALLAAAAAVPLLARDGRGMRLCDAVAAQHGALGHWATAAPLPAGLGAPYLAVTLCFYAAVVLIGVGNALFKPILTVVIGRLPFTGEPERSAAFTTFFLYVNIGGLLAVVLGGWLSQRFGWSFAFAGSALGMLVSIATMVLLDARYIRPFLGHGPEPRGAERSGLGAGSRVWTPLLTLLALVVVCASFSYQSYGFIALFTSQLVARDVGGVTIPAAWFTALNPITIMLLTPLLLALWRRGGPGARWTEVQRIGVALMLMCVGFAPLAAAAGQATGGRLASPLWVAGSVMVIAASELFYSPAALAAATRVAPRRLQTLAVGSQGAATGIGAWFSGQIGALAFESDKAFVMGAVAAAALAAGLTIFRSQRLFARLGL